MIKNNSIEELLNKEGFIITDIQGKSMFPFLKPGKHKVIISIPNKQIKKYDVVLFKINNKYILHRVIDIDNNNLIIRGDNTVSCEIVNKDDILGVLTSYYDHDKCIDVDENINEYYYNKSIKSLKYRKLKHKLATLIKQGRK